MNHIREFKDQHEYHLVRPIAHGGMGEVYEAIQYGASGFEKQVAIKVIREEFSMVPEFQKNFIGEARLVADLIHTNIVQIYQLGSKFGQYYMVMEFVDGWTLEEVIMQHRAIEKEFPPKLAAFIISRICRGLAYAHGKKDSKGNNLGIVHRDVSPRNIMLGKSGDVKLTDFGIAKAFNLMYSEEGEIIAGKNEYLSPEQAKREVTDARADLFPCGILLAEMICGKNIFEGNSGEESRQRVLNMPLPDFAEINPNIEPGLNEILHRILERDREKRFQSAAEMMTALEYHLYHREYGPTNEKLARYLQNLFIDGKAFEETLPDNQNSFGLNCPKTNL